MGRTAKIAALLAAAAPTLSEAACTKPSTTGYDLSTGVTETQTAQGTTFAVTGGACATGYSGTVTHATCQTDNNAWVVSGCEADCTDPSTTGYTLGAVTGSKAKTGFSVAGGACATGYTGTPTFTACLTGGQAYTVAGCQINCDNTAGTAATGNAPCACGTGSCTSGQFCHAATDSCAAADVAACTVVDNSKVSTTYPCKCGNSVCGANHKCKADTHTCEADACSSVDGKAVSDVYPCKCGTSTAACTKNQKCTTNTCSAFDACSKVDGSAKSTTYPCKCGTNACKTDEKCTSASNKCEAETTAANTNTTAAPSANVDGAMQASTMSVSVAFLALWAFVSAR